MTLSIDSTFAPLSFPALGQRHDDGATVRGHATGYAAGRKQAEQELAQLRATAMAEMAQHGDALHGELERAIAAVTRAAEEFRAREVAAIESVDAAIASAAVELAEAIVGYELSATDHSARAAVERAARAAGAIGATIRLSPDDLAVVTSHAEFAAGLELVADPTLARGDALVEMLNGSIDARISSSVARVRAALAEGAA